MCFVEIDLNVLNKHAAEQIITHGRDTVAIFCGASYNTTVT